MPDENVVEPDQVVDQGKTPVEPQETPQEEVSEEVALENSKNPERTKEYIDKLKEENKKYKNVLDSLKPSSQAPQVQPPVAQPVQAPSAQQYSHLNQADVNNVYKSMIDAEGYLDGNKLIQTLQQMNQRAIAAEQRAARVEEHVKRRELAETESQKTSLMKQVHEKYPQLDPENEGFDSEFYDLVRNDLIGQMMEGREDPMSAADKWAGKLNMTKKEKEQVEKVTEQKTQINAMRPRSPMMKGYYEKEEAESLTNSIRQGKKGAVAEALRRMNQ